MKVPWFFLTDQGLLVEIHSLSYSSHFHSGFYRIDNGPMSWNPKKRSIVYVISDANNYLPHPVHPLLLFVVDFLLSMVVGGLSWKTL